MNRLLTPRFARRFGALVLLAGITSLFAQKPDPAGNSGVPLWNKGAPSAEKLGWRLGLQAWTFHKFTFFEAVDKAASVGLKYIEAYPGQPLSPEHRDVRMGPDMGRQYEEMVKQKLAAKEMKLVNFGVTGLPPNTQGIRRIFEWARRMGIETIVSEAPPKVLDLAEPLCEEYGINIALHNHPKPRSRYWNPQTIVDVCKGRSPRIGACCDTGHWMRSGIRPIDGVRLLRGRIISFHFKDLNRMGGGAHDVPWGTGKGDLENVLRELREQGFRGVFSIEYEYHWDNSLPEIAQCVQWFEETCRKLLEKPPVKTAPPQQR